MKRILVALSFIVALVLIVNYSGCGPRAEVAKDKVLAKIDEMLGKLDVELKTVEGKIEELEKAKDNIQKTKHEMKARLDLADNKLEPLKKSIGSYTSALKTIQGLLKNEGDEVEFNGKKYTKADLGKDAEVLLNKADKAKKHLAAQEENMKVIKTTHDRLVAQQAMADKRLASLQNSIETIKLKKENLDALKIAGKAQSVTLGSTFDEAEKAVEDLLVSIDAELAKEDEDFAEAAAKTTSPDVIASEFTTETDISDRLKDFLGDDSEN